MTRTPHDQFAKVLLPAWLSPWLGTATPGYGIASDFRHGADQGGGFLLFFFSVLRKQRGKHFLLRLGCKTWSRDRARASKLVHFVTVAFSLPLEDLGSRRPEGRRDAAASMATSLSMSERPSSSRRGLRASCGR